MGHNGFNFDFAILLNALKRHGLINTSAEVKLLLLDSLKLLAEEVNTKQAISSCPSKSLGVVYEHLFNTQFKACDAAEDTEALSCILIKTEVHINKAITTTHCLTSQDMQDCMQEREKISAMKSTLSRMSISETMSRPVRTLFGRTVLRPNLLESKM